MKGEGGKIKNSPRSPCGRGVGGEGDYKNGMLPKRFVVGLKPKRFVVGL
jgi:hypothetical protein